jgi:hypothetical protein
MTGEERGEKAVTQSRSPVDAHAGIAGSPREDQTRPAGNSVRDGEVTTSTNPSIAALEQWIYLLLGATCMGCGVWGICMKYSQSLSSGYVQWLGPAYGPALRLTALACLVFGAVLVRLGLARPGRSSDSDNPKVLPSVGRNRGRHTKVPPARRSILGVEWKGKGRNSRERQP